MACDRIVRFKSSKFPTQEEVEKCLRNYIGFAGAVTQRIDEENDRFIVSLPGKPTSPFEGIKGSANIPLREERWFEVWIDGFPDDNTMTIDVITREQDEFTMNIAQGFAELLARFWSGTLEQ